MPERIEICLYCSTELITRLEREKRGSIRFSNLGRFMSLLFSMTGRANVRELANLVERMRSLHPHGVIGGRWELPRSYER